jgi:plasmid stabilization system protein ParE
MTPRQQPRHQQCLSVFPRMTLSRGLYDLVLTEAVARSLEEIAPDVPHLGDFDNADAAERLIEVLGRQLRHILDHLDGGDEGRAQAQLALVNALLAQLRADRHEAEDLVDLV